MDMREIRYFVACVQTGSFSRAAEVLFTTQSSVSKIIKALEEDMNLVLFERLPRGIRMTREAERIYPYALSILDDLQKMQMPDKEETIETLSVSCNPSSWFADCFTAFYEQKQKEKIHYQIYSADCREIVERVRERTDDIGFVYILKDRLTVFQYYISRDYLEFTVLKETTAVLYGGKNCEGGKNETVDFSRMKLIQRFPDEFSPDNYWNITDDGGRSATDAETVITTNSDYIMERFLQSEGLVNISAGYLSGKPSKENAAGWKRNLTDTRILFGYIRRRGEELSGQAGDFLAFIKERLLNG